MYVSTRKYHCSKKALHLLKINWRKVPIVDDTLSLLFQELTGSTVATETQVAHSCFLEDLSHGQGHLTPAGLSGVDS